MKKEYIYAGGKLIATEEPFNCSGGAPIALPPSSLPPGDTVWGDNDDQVPTGATLTGTWTWDTNQKASGTKSHTEPAASGMHQHYFAGATQTLSVAAGESLVGYVLINPCSPPQEVMLQYQDSTGSWEHRAFWGADLIAWGSSGTASRYPMGGLPSFGAWIRLEVLASNLGLEGKVITGMAFVLYDGQAWFDRAAKKGVCQVPVPLPPSSLPPDTVWVEDQVPTGATPQGTWNWDMTQKASGTHSHTDSAAPGLHQHYFTGTSLYVGSGEKLVCYVMINPCNPPQEIMLQWKDSDNSWEHRAFWGADLITSGSSGTSSRYPMGALPGSGSWVRLEVPAASVGLAGKVITGMAFTLYDGQAWFDRAGKGGCEVPLAVAPSSLPPDTVWVEDLVPAGATPQGTWNWDMTQKASGTQSHTEPAAPGLHQHYFTNASLYVASAERLVCYVLINPCDPPREIMLQFLDSAGSWEHRAYWGADLITAWGVNGTASRYPMGALPQSGAWVRLEVPAANVGLAGKVITGMAFTLHDGQAWFDRAGKTVCQPAVASPPYPLPADTVWVEDQLPSGAVPQGTWNWDTTQKASGIQSHADPAAPGMHEHYFTGATQTLSVATGEKLVCYVLIDPCDPPQEIMLQFLNSASGSWDHRAYWGADLYTTWGVNGTASRYPMGALPQSGAWVRLEVPASAVGLEGKTLTGMAFTVYGGKAWFDRAGKAAP